MLPYGTRCYWHAVQYKQTHLLRGGDYSDIKGVEWAAGGPRMSYNYIALQSAERVSTSLRLQSWTIRRLSDHPWYVRDTASQGTGVNAIRFPEGKWNIICPPGVIVSILKRRFYPRFVKDCKVPEQQLWVLIHTAFQSSYNITFALWSVLVSLKLLWQLGYHCGIHSTREMQWASRWVQSSQNQTTISLRKVFMYEECHCSFTQP